MFKCKTAVLIAITCLGLLPMAKAVTPAPDGGYSGMNTAEGTSALFNLTTGVQNTALGYQTLFTDKTGSGNTAIGFNALRFTTASDNTATGGEALYKTTTGTQNTAHGRKALQLNSTGSNNTAVGNGALQVNTDGSENTAVGAGAGQNIAHGFNNTYVGDFVGIIAPDENSTIRIGDLSNGNGAGSLECFIGGIFNNFQPRGGSVVVVTLDLNDDHLGWDIVANPIQGGSAPNIPVPRSAPLRRSAPGAPTQRPTNDKVSKVEKLEATVAQQQKQLETLTAQLKEQSAQIQRVSAAVAASKAAQRVVTNR